MAGGATVAAPNSRAHLYNGRVTWAVVVTIACGACGGLLFGYDVGVSGGVTSMHAWQYKFFPSVLQHIDDPRTPYCKYDNQGLQAFTSSLYLAGAFSALFAGWATHRWGRRTVVVAASGLFLVGTLLQAAAQALAMLIIGRLVLGVAVGFANQAVPVYLSEMAPTRIRGACNITFQMAITLGILSAQLINFRAKDYATNDHGQGWRYALGFGGELQPMEVSLPSCCWRACSSSPTPPTPSSSGGGSPKPLESCNGSGASRTSKAEFEGVVGAARQAGQVTNPWGTILERRFRPQLMLAILIPVFQQLTGINSIMFYAPQVFASLGSGNEVALLNTVVIGAVNVAATLVAICVVDRFGRRVLFLEGGIQMSATLIVCGVVLGVEFAAHGSALPDDVAKGVLAVICIFVSGFAWSWGALGWLVPIEIQPLETRSAGQAINVFINFVATFIIGQCFLSMLCAMEFGVFLFFAAWAVLMTTFAGLFIPETRGVPIEQAHTLFREHWAWRHIMGPEEPQPHPTPPAHPGSSSTSVELAAGGGGGQGVPCGSSGAQPGA